VSKTDRRDTQDDKKQALHELERGDEPQNAGAPPSDQPATQP
jgi:hypothetical protein